VKYPIQVFYRLGSRTSEITDLGIFKVYLVNKCSIVNFKKEEITTVKFYEIIMLWHINFEPEKAVFPFLTHLSYCFYMCMIDNITS